MRVWKFGIMITLIVSLLLGCSNASSYLKDQYPLVDVQGKGKESAKVYSAVNKDVPTVAKEIADKEPPIEKSKDDKEKMFLIYKDKIINVQKDPKNELDTLVEVDSIAYAKDNYGSSFLQGYITASILQSVLGGGWFGQDRANNDYRGYSSLPRSTESSRAPPVTDKNKPTTSDRTGAFNSKPTGKNGTTDTSTGSVKSTAAETKSSGSSGTFTTKKSSETSSTYARKNDGSAPSYKSPAKPKTSIRSGSFSKRK